MSRIQDMLNAKTNSIRKGIKKGKALFSALKAPIGAASFLKEGYIVYGFADATQYAERHDSALEKRKSKLRSVYTTIVMHFLGIRKVLPYL